MGLLSSFLGLNGLNFLLSAGQPAASLALPPSSVPTLALPYVLVPSAALSSYPLVASSLQQQGSDAHTKLSFGLPAMMSPAHFMVGGAPYSVVPVPPPSTPEQSGLYRSSVGTPHSPSGPRQTININTPEPMVRADCTAVTLLSLSFTHTHTHAELSALKYINVISLHNET